MEKSELQHEELAQVGDDTKGAVTGTGLREARTFDPKFIRRVRLKTDLVLLPLMVAIYLTSSLDKSNLGNAKTLGMIRDIGGDPDGSKYAFLVSLYFIGYAPLMVPFTLLAKRTNMKNFMTIAAIIWGIAATCFAAVTNFSGAYACRFIIGLGEAGFVPVFLVFLSRFYTRRALGTRMAIWLTMAPFGGFMNGILAYAFSYVRGGPLESWRALFLCEGLLTFVLGVAGFLILPNDIPTCRWFTSEEKDYLMYERSVDYGHESKEINWQHARAVIWRWQQVLPILMYMCQQITGAALSAFLPSLMTDLGFSGANAQLATLGPYGGAMVGMVLACNLSDRYKNRGWPCQSGWAMCVVAFAIYLGCDPKNSPARFVALVLAEVGHYISTPLIIVWGSNNAGNESRRAVTLPLANSLAQAIAIGAGYLFPAKDAPKYTMGSAAELGLSALGCIFTAAYQILLWRENRRRDADEGGKPDEDFQPDVDTYADDAPGFRYIL